MAAPFDCACGSDACVGHVQGMKHLPAERQAALKPLATPVIQGLLAAATD